MNLKNFFKELSRRNVIKETISYLIVAWVILQVATIILPTFDAPEWILKTLTVFLIACIPLVIIFSWIYQLTDKGIKYMSSKKDEDINSSNQKPINILLVVSSIAALLLFGIISKRFISEEKASEFSIAIIPFKNINLSENENWFAEGLREDIWRRLVKLEGLDPVSNRSSESEILKTKPIKEIADILTCKYLVEGNVSKSGRHIILNITLWDSKENIIWQKDYNEPLSNLIKLQSTLSKAIIDGMKFKINQKEKILLEDIETENIDAYLMVKKGERSLFDYELEESLNYFVDAKSLDSTYANAHSYIAFINNILAQNETMNKEKINHIISYTKRALELDPNDCLAHLNLANLSDIYFYDYSDAQKHYKKALELCPKDPLLHFEYSLFLRSKIPRDLDKSLIHIKKAYQLDPLNYIFGRNLIYAYLIHNRFKDAYHILDQIVPLAPNNPEIFREEFTALIATEETKSRNPQLNFLNNRKLVDSLDQKMYSHWLARLAIFYDMYYNNDEKFLDFAHEAFTIDSSKVIIYISALIENYNQKDALKYLKSSHFEYHSEDRKSRAWFKYYISLNDFKAAKQIIDSTVLSKNKYYLAYFQAKSGLLQELDSFPIHKPMTFSAKEKVVLYAILGNRDSLYQYLNHPMIEYSLDINSKHELDPYREDPEYKAFQTKFYLK